MWGIEEIKRINDPSCIRHEPHPLRFHPAILRVRRFVNSLPVDYVYKMRMKKNIYALAEVFANRESNESVGWADWWENEDAIQQLTLHQMTEEWLAASFKGDRYETDER